MKLNPKTILCHVLGFVFISITVSFSQAIVGTVSDAESRKPLADVNITLTGTVYGTSSQQDGTFNLEGITPGNYNLEAAMMGYKTYRMALMVTPDSLLSINIPLVPTVLQLRPIEVTAQKYRNVISEPQTESQALTPAISTVKAHEIEKQGARTLIESVRYIPGAFIETRGRKVKQFFSMRGQKYPYPEYAINGTWQREFHELPYFFSSADIEKIELVRSSAALLTGLTGMVGIIKVDTKHYETTETSYGLEYGTFGTYRARLSHGSKLDRISYATGIGIQGTKGPQGRNAGERMANFYGRLEWFPSQKINMDFNIFHLNGFRELALAEPPANKRLQTEISKYDPYKATLVNLKTFYRPSQNTSSELLLYYTKRDPVYITQADPTPISTSEEDYEYGLNFTQAVSPMKNNIMRVGGLYNHWVAPNGKRFYVGRKTDLETFSFVIVDEQQIGNLNLDAGLRWSKTYIAEYGAFNIGGVAGGFSQAEPIVDQWEPGILNATLGAAYHFRYPLSIHLNLAAGQIKPREGSLTITLDRPKNENRYKADLGVQTMAEDLGKLTLAAFYIQQKDAIVLTDTMHIEDGRILEYYDNRDQDQFGLEFEMRSPHWFNLLECFINTVALYSRFDDQGSMKINQEYPRFIASAGAYLDYLNFDLNVFAKFVSSFESTRFVGRVNNQPPQPQPLGDYLVINSTLGWTFGHRFKTRIFLEVLNLSDKRYSTVAGYPDFGRRMILGISQNIK